MLRTYRHLVRAHRLPVTWNKRGIAREELFGGLNELLS